MSGSPIVARAITELQEDLPIKQCLMALFSFELENADLKMPAFNDRYEKEIIKYSKAWTAPTDEGD